MSHGDQVTQAPTGFRIIATTRTAPFAAVAHEEKHYFGIQFHPEVTHTVNGGQVLKNFVVGICKCNTNWTMVRACFFILSLSFAILINH